MNPGDAGNADRARRLFFAVWPGAEPRTALGLACAAAIAASGGRAVPADSLHLTLAFLGQVRNADCARLEAIGADLALPQVVIEFDRLEHWPRARVLVAGPSTPPPPLLELRAALNGRLAADGFRIESAAWRPHVTLARKVARQPPAVALAGVRWPLETLALVVSVPAAGGSRYTPLAAWSARR